MRSEVPSDRNPLLFRDLLNGFFTVSRYEVLCGLVKGTVPLFFVGCIDARSAHRGSR